MADLPSAGAKLELDLSEWESNWSSVMGDASDLQSTLDDLSGSVDVDVNLDIPDTSAIDDLEALDGEQITPEIDTTESEDSKDIRDGIMFLATMKAIEVAINVVGTALDFINAVGSMVVSPFLDVEDAVAKINAQTGSGTGIRDLGDFIRDIQAADLGDSVDQISDMVIHAAQLDAPIKEATTASLTFVKVFDDQNPVTVMDTLKAASDEFEISITSAGDALTVFFQNGGNKGGDALTAVDKYSTSWKDMNLTFTEGLSLLQSLQEGGVDSADEAGRMIQTFDDAFTTAAADPNSQQAQFLAAHGLDNPKAMGEAIGAETIDGFISAFTTLPAGQQDLASQLFFGKGGKLNTGAIAGATTQSSIFQDYIGAAEDAATEIDNSLRGAIDDFILEVNTKIAELLSSDAIDLPGKIAALKEGLQEAVDVIASGGSIGEAIEIGLNIPGFNDSVQRFEASIGNFAIGVLEIIASIQDFLGKDSSGTREQISALAGNQLAFNLKVANEDEIAGEITSAVDRGLTSSDLAKSATSAIEELVAAGELDKAQVLVDSLNELKKGEITISTDIGGTDLITAQGALFSGSAERIQEQLDAGNLVAPVSIDTEMFQTEIDKAQEQLDTVFGPQEGRGTAVNGFQNLDALNELTGDGGVLSSLATDLDVAVASLSSLDTTGDAAAANIAEAFFGISSAATTDIGATTQQVDDLAAKFEDADTRINTAATGNTITASFEAIATAAASSFPGVIAWFEQTTQAAATMDSQISSHVQHLINILKDLQFLSAQVSTGVQQAIALGGQLPSGGNVTNNNVTVNNNVPNSAAAAAGSYTLAASLRPGGV